MINECFPNALLEYFVKNQDSHRSEKKSLKAFFDKDELTKLEFFDWANSHTSIVEGSPRLIKALKIASKQHTKSITQKTIDLGGICLSKTESNTTVKKKAFQNDLVYKFEAALALCYLKIITMEHLLILYKEIIDSNEPIKNILEVLSCQLFFEFDNSCLFNAEILKLTLPFIHKLSDETFLKLLSVRDCDGASILHKRNLLEIILPLFESRIPEIFIKLILSQEKMGLTPLHDVELFAVSYKSLKYFISKCPNYIAQLFSKKDVDGNTPLHKVAIFNRALPLLGLSQSEKEIETLAKIFSIKNKAGNTPLHTNNLDRKALRLFKKFSFLTLESQLVLRNKIGNTPLFYEPIIKIAMKLFDSNQDKKSREMMLILLCSQNKKGDTPLHDLYLFYHALPFLDKLPVNDLKILLSIKNKNEKTPILNLYLLFKKIKTSDEKYSKNFGIVTSLHSKLLLNRLGLISPVTEIDTNIKVIIPEIKLVGAIENVSRPINPKIMSGS